MPKESKHRSLSSDRCKASPYPCSSKSSMQSLPEPPLEDMKEWEEARCPVCMEHPHNAVLLLCSSHEKGCRPYMCDTSYRHSNCLDQFCKSFTENPPTPPQEEPANSSAAPQAQISETRMNLLEERSVEDTLNALGPVQHVPCEHKVPQKLVCPLCRGQVNGWIVMESARKFMNSKSRSCACETCIFSGNYSDLRKHARIQHPRVRPSVVDPERQQAWTTLERERDLGDVLSTMRSLLREERGVDGILEGSLDGIFTPVELDGNGSLLTVIFFFRFFRPASGSGSGSGSVSGSGSGSAGATGGNNSSSGRWSLSTSRRLSRSRGQSRNQRRTDTLWGETYETDDDSSVRDEDNDLSENWPDSWGHSERRQR